MMAELSKLEERVYGYVADYIKENGCGPRYAEMAMATGLHIGTISGILVKLRCRKLLTWKKGYMRTMRLI